MDKCGTVGAPWREVGYEANMLHAAPYDWRLSPTALEQRDGYFTRLKSSIEVMVKLHGVRVALLAHSYGDNLVGRCRLTPG